VFPPRHSYLVPLPNGSGLALGERPLVMGVLNVTPDSFADVERFREGTAIEAALEMEAAASSRLARRDAFDFTSPVCGRRS